MSFIGTHLLVSGIAMNERSFVIEKKNSVKKKLFSFTERKVKNIKAMLKIVQGAEAGPPEHILINTSNN